MAKLPMNAYNWTWQGISLHFFLKKISRLKSKVSIFSHYSELPLTYCSEEDKRVLCQLLNKLYIPDVADRYRIRSMKLLMVNLRAVSSSSSLSCHCLIECILQRRPLRDHASKTAFSKFETAFTKKFEKLLEDFSEEEFRKLEELDELFMFLDSIFPPEDEETEADIPRKRGRKRCDAEFVFVVVLD